MDSSEPQTISDPDAVPATELASELTLGQTGAPVAVEAVTPRLPQLVRGKIDKFGTALGTGRRKTAVARVRLKDGPARSPSMAGL